MPAPGTGCLSTVEVRRHDGVAVVAPVGDVDLLSADDLRVAILAAMSNDSPGVIVDLSRTRYLDSAGIRVLFSIARRLEERRRRLVLVAPADALVRRLLEIVDIEARADLVETVGAARERLPAP